jgi:hypothetical protein
MPDYKQFCVTIEVAPIFSHELKKALTHYSFSENSQNGSRYMFLGQTEFKGKVARILFEYVPGKGTQLQHYLGNLFKEKHLHYIFEKYNLKDYIRLGVDYDYQTLKHIFTYGFLGFLSDSMETKVLNDFIMKNFIENTAHLLPKEKVHKKDYKAQFQFLAQQQFSTKPKLDIHKKGDTYCCTVSIADDIYSQVESKSYKYAQKKAWKVAIRNLAQKNENTLLQNPDYVEREKQRQKIEKERQEKEKEQKLAQYFEKRKKRGEDIRANKIRKLQEKEEKLKKRKLAKQRTKERRKLAAKQEQLKNIGLENISSSKRRILEDRGILPKRK